MLFESRKPCALNIQSPLRVMITSTSVMLLPSSLSRRAMTLSAPLSGRTTRVMDMHCFRSSRPRDSFASPAVFHRPAPIMVSFVFSVYRAVAARGAPAGS